MKLRATSFATPQDKEAYDKCRAAGHSDHYCTSTPGGGDNCIGAWGKDTSTTEHAYCALGPSLTKHGRRVRVTLYHGEALLGQPFECTQEDKGDEGVIDLNPGALVAAGLPADTELGASAIVEFLDQ